MSKGVAADTASRVPPRRAVTILQIMSRICSAVAKMGPNPAEAWQLQRSGFGTLNRPQLGHPAKACGDALGPAPLAPR